MLNQKKHIYIIHQVAVYKHNAKSALSVAVSCEIFPAICIKQQRLTYF